MRRVTLVFGAIAAIMSAGCSPQQQSASQEDPIASAQTPPESEMTTQSGRQQIASVALSLSDTRNEPVDMIDTLKALDAEVARSGSELSPTTRAAIKADLQSAKDAAQLKDWQAVREAASSIYEKLL
jgi:hypothetical protein